PEVDERPPEVAEEVPKEPRKELHCLECRVAGGLRHTGRLEGLRERAPHVAGNPARGGGGGEQPRVSDDVTGALRKRTAIVQRAGDLLLGQPDPPAEVEHL